MKLLFIVILPSYNRCHTLSSIMSGRTCMNVKTFPLQNGVNLGDRRRGTTECPQYARAAAGHHVPWTCRESKDLETWPDTRYDQRS